MATKRLSLMLEECGEEEHGMLLLKYDEDEEDERRSAKRCKLNRPAKPSLESPLQRMLKRQIAVSSCTLSPITELWHNMRNTLLNGGTLKSKTMRSFHSVSSSYDSGNCLDDEYIAMFELKSLDQLPLDKLPDDLDALISGELKSPKLETSSSPPPDGRHLRKSMSMNNVDILNALDDEPELIGDLSKPCALPILVHDVRHRDLKAISCETLARLLRGEFAELTGHFKIIDCRYPYEFDGGHIRGALNLYTRPQIMEAFPTSATESDAEAHQRNIFVFHCEFSMARGPKLLRFLRNNDRSLHTHNYPTLDYPELYLLHNGYKEFFSCYAHLCEPCNYVPMLAPAHNEEYRLFRAKTKSWQCSSDSEGGDSDIGGGSSHASGPSRSRTLYKPRSLLFYAE